MSITGLIEVLVLLQLFVFVPLLLMGCCSNRAQRSKPGLHECPHCGAQNYAAQPHCYCCGHKFILPLSPAPAATVIQRVRQADNRRTRQQPEASTPQASSAA
ncbi:MAG: hypothetical protein ABSG14_08435 [Verrucomicrobiia bacterium]|jgi:hypothetical protein